MATNNFGTLVNAELTYDIVDDLEADLDPLFNLAYDFGQEDSDLGEVATARPGSTIQITDFTYVATAYDVDPAVGYVAQNYAAKPQIPFTLPSAVKAASFSLTPEEFRVLQGAPRQNVAYENLRDKVRRGMRRGLQEEIVGDFLAVITAAAFPNNTPVAAGTFGRSTETTLDKELFKRNLADRTNATVVLEPDAYGEWIDDHIATVHANTGQGQGARLISNGVTSSNSPFTFHRTNVDMPTDAARGFAFTRTAAIFVARAPDEPSTGDSDPVALEVVQGARGMPFLMRAWKDPKTGNIQLDLATIYKFQALQAEALERITLT
ncbi:MAG: hypothetical protein AAF236_00755 [Verrucomicrobiota bacterium]